MKPFQKWLLGDNSAGHGHGNKEETDRASMLRKVSRSESMLEIIRHRDISFHEELVHPNQENEP
jgi:hypothetical protein